MTPTAADLLSALERLLSEIVFQAEDETSSQRAEWADALYNSPAFADALKAVLKAKSDDCA